MFTGYFRHAQVYYDRLLKDMNNLVKQYQLFYDKWKTVQKENEELRGVIETLLKPKEAIKEEQEFIKSIKDKYALN